MSSDRYSRKHEIVLLCLSGIILMVITSAIIITVSGESWAALALLGFWMFILTLIMLYDPNKREY